ncbi:MAG: ATP-binding protein [Candidatus Kapabacteria bacterium]|nr:ATP-binding protein [Candidatus Kapabacteria bacterium]
MKNYYLPLFWKFSIAVVLIVIVFGTVNLFVIYGDITDLQNDESGKKASFISSLFFNQTDDLIKTNDLGAFQKLVSSFHKSDSSIAYTTIYLNSLDRTILSSDNIDGWIVVSDYKSDDKLYKVYNNENNPTEKITEISFRMPSDTTVVAVIGIYETKQTHSTHELIYPFLIMITVFLLAGVLAAFIFAGFITKPIKEIIQIADNPKIDLLPNRTEYFFDLTQKLGAKIFKNVRVKDELDILVLKFNKMVKSLDVAYKEKELSYTKLMQAEKLASVGTLTAGFAHEVNNPIAGIKNCVIRIKKNPHNYSQNEEYLDLMYDAIIRTEEVVKRLLDYSRTQDIVFEKVQINDVIEKSILLIAYKFEKHHISIHNKSSHNLPEISGNFNQLEQVFVNVLINSVHAIESAQLQNMNNPLLIEINTYLKENKIYVEIKDFGIGIEADKLETIFDPFYTSKEIGKGTGLGLFVCYNIVRSHKGSIKVESNYGGYTKFVLEFSVD